MSELDDTSHEAPSATAPRWRRSQALELVHQLNEHCLELLAGVATADAGSDCPLVAANRDLWTKLSTEARRRAAFMPFVILDLHFANEGWWRRVTDASGRAVDKRGKTVDFLLRPDRGIAAAQAFFRKALATSLPRWPRKIALDGR